MDNSVPASGTSFSDIRFRYWLPLAIFIAAFLSRLPQFLSPFFYPDGDEAIVGLMAKHFAEGKGFSIYFYGQSYGLAGIESAAAALFFLVFGVSAFTLKASMLFLWATGVCFHAGAFRRWRGGRAAVLVAAFLLICPGWAIWSIKARGGYVTAFFLEGLILLLLARQGRDLVRWMAIGFCLYLVFEAQMLWLTVVAPFVIWKMLASQWIRKTAGLATGLVLSILLIKSLLPADQSNYWRPDVISGLEIRDNLKRLPDRINTTLSGSFDLSNRQLIGRANEYASLLWSLITAGLALISIFRLRSRKTPFPLLLLICLLLIIGYTFIASPEAFGHRYMLPLAGLIPVWLGYEADIWLRSRNIIKVPVLLFLAGLTYLSVFSLFEARNHKVLDYDSSHNHLDETQSLITDLEKQNIRHSFCMNGLFQWQLAFLSREQITCRYYGLTDRYIPYIEEVNLAYQQRRPTAIVGFNHEANILTYEKGIDSSLIRQHGMFFYIPNPDTAVLKKAGFDLK